MFTLAQRAVMWLIAIAIFIENADATALTTAIPSMALSLQQNPLNLKIALTSYLFSLAVFMPASGWLTDKFGTKKIFGLALTIFTIGSICCGLAHNLFFLVLARILQGFGGAILMPTARIAIFQTFPRSEIMKVNTYTTIPGMLGWIVGPVIGGILTTHLSWRWIFYINIPFGLIGLYLTYKYLHNYKKPKIESLDTLGFLLFGIGLACLCFSLGMISEGLFQTQLNLVVFTSGFLALLFYALHTRRPQHKLLDLSLFKIRTFSISMLGTAINRICLGGIPFVIALLLQNGLGHNAAGAGYIMVGYALGAIASRAPCKITLAKFGFKKQLIAGAILVSVSIIGLASINGSTPTWLIISLLFFHGAISGAHFVSMNLLYYSDTDAEQISKVSVFVSVNQQICMSIGVALAAILLHHFFNWHGTVMQMNIPAFQTSLLILSVIPLLSLFVYAKLKKHDGAAMSSQ